VAVPGAHPYVEQITDPSVVEVVSPGQGQLDAHWVRHHASRVDVVHLHQGLDAASIPCNAATLVDALQAHGLPSVVTLHQPPCEAVDEPHPELDAIVPAADAVIALTPQAAGVARRRWSLDPLVLPHPAVAPPEEWVTTAAGPRRPGPWRVGLHRHGDRQASATLLEALEQLAARRDDVAVAVWSAAGGPADPGVRQWIAGLDLLVLPPALPGQATWLELCRDLGTGAVVAVTGPAVQLAATASYPAAATRAGVITRVVARALDELPVTHVDVDARSAEVAQVRDEHVALYRALLAAATPTPDEDLSDDGSPRHPW
jgi:beta-1,4-mannosyltransferase